MRCSCWKYDGSGPVFVLGDGNGCRTTSVRAQLRGTSARFVPDLSERQRIPAQSRLPTPVGFCRVVFSLCVMSQCCDQSACDQSMCDQSVCDQSQFSHQTVKSRFSTVSPGMCLPGCAKLGRGHVDRH